MKVTFWLIRHARPDVLDGLCYGQTDLPALTEENTAAARALAHQLKENLRNHKTGIKQSCVVYTSTLQRARQLGMALQSHLPALHILHDARLNEMHFGRWEMQLWKEIPKADIDHWVEHFGSHKFGGIESCQMVLNRVIEAYQAICVDLRRMTGPNQHVHLLWVTHAGVIRAWQYFFESGTTMIENSQSWPISAPEFGEWLQYSIELD